MWSSPLARDGGRAATVLSWALLLAVVYGLTRVLSGRAAYIHTGAMLGTIMVANVWMRIVPAQRDQIASATAGRTPDATLATRAKQRSTHNSYVTFPVIFMMLSHHYPLTYGHRLNWLVLWLLIVVGAGVRHVMIAREHGRRADWWLVPVAAAVAAVVYLTSPAWLGAATRGGERVAFDAANTVIAYGRDLSRFAGWVGEGGLTDYQHPTIRGLSHYVSHLREEGLAILAERGLRDCRQIAGHHRRAPDLM